MVRIAKPANPKKIKELKKRIKDPVYIEIAIEQIASTLTNEYVTTTKESK
jgi:hypothetical protein